PSLRSGKFQPRRYGSDEHSGRGAGHHRGEAGVVSPPAPLIALRALLSAVAPIAIGTTVVGTLPSNLRSQRCLYWTTVISVGLGVDALLFFWFRRAFLTIEWLLVIPAILASWNFGTETKISASPPEFGLRPEIVKGLRGLLIIAAVTGVLLFAFQT